MTTGDTRALASEILRRDRILITTCILLICAVAWAYLVHLGDPASSTQASPTTMAGMGMPIDAPVGLTGVLLTFTMWAVMMVGMMGPTATPVLLLLAASHAHREERGVPTIVLLFGLGYVTIWLGFSIGATFVHWTLNRAMQLSPSMAVASPLAAGALFIAAGGYQLTSFKNACLEHCQTPMSFLMSHWREGPGGAFQMGLRHGLYCLGCCWALMALLFALGVMNLLWVAVLTVFILAERVGKSAVVSRAGGVVMIAVGVFLMAARWR
jgi:predicted metal-binding membrane protein